MADINVERRGPRVWPWILGIIILIVLIWAITEMLDRNGEPPQRESVEVVPAPVGPGEPVQPPPGSAPSPGTGEATPGTAPAPGTGTSPGTSPPPGAGNPGGQTGTPPGPNR